MWLSRIERPTKKCIQKTSLKAFLIEKPVARLQNFYTVAHLIQSVNLTGQDDPAKRFSDGIRVHTENRFEARDRARKS